MKSVAIKVFFLVMHFVALLCLFHSSFLSHLWHFNLVSVVLISTRIYLDCLCCTKAPYAEQPAAKRYFLAEEQLRRSPNAYVAERALAWICGTQTQS